MAINPNECALCGEKPVETTVIGLQNLKPKTKFYRVAESQEKIMEYKESTVCICLKCFSLHAKEPDKKPTKKKNKTAPIPLFPEQENPYNEN